MNRRMANIGVERTRADAALPRCVLESLRK